MEKTFESSLTELEKIVKEKEEAINIQNYEKAAKLRDMERNLIEKLELINPLGVLKRGYVLAYQDTKVVKSVKDVSNSSNLC